MVVYKKLRFVSVLLLSALVQVGFVCTGQDSLLETLKEYESSLDPKTYAHLQELFSSSQSSEYLIRVLGAALIKLSLQPPSNTMVSTNQFRSVLPSDHLDQASYGLWCDNMYAFPKYVALVLGTAIMAGVKKSKNCCCKTCRFKQITAFGDSYTDVGNAPARPETPCFSSSGAVAPDTNPGGKLWIQGLSKALCINIRPSSQGGSDYAISGATSAQMLEQAQTFAQSNRVLCNNLVTVRPVITDLVNAILIDGTPPPIQEVVDNTLATIATLHNAGACYILVPNMINLGLLPSFSVIDDIPEIGTATSVAFNALFTQGVNDFCFDVLQVDAFGLEQEIFAKPCCFCFQDMQDPCCCVCPAFPTPNCCTAYFWDLLDPTGRAHQSFAQYVTAILNGPGCFARVAEFSLEALYGHNTVLKQQLAPLFYEKKEGCPAFFMGADYAPVLQHPLEKCCSGRHTKARSFSLVAGGIYPLSEQSLIGVSYGFSRPESTSGCCEFETNMHTGSLFATCSTSRYYATVIGNASALDHSIDRHFNILTRRTHAKGSTHGNQVGLEVEGAYYFAEHDQLKSGMLAQFEYNRIKTYGYTEHNAGSSNLSYKDRIRHACITGLGIQANTHKDYCSGHLVVNLFGMLSRDWLIEQHDVRFHVASMRGSHARLPFCLPYKLVLSGGVDMSFSTECGIVATLGYHTKLGAQKYYTNLIAGSLSWNF